MPFESFHVAQNPQPELGSNLTPAVTSLHLPLICWLSLPHTSGNRDIHSLCSHPMRHMIYCNYMDEAERPFSVCSSY